MNERDWDASRRDCGCDQRGRVRPSLGARLDLRSIPERITCSFRATRRWALLAFGLRTHWGRAGVCTFPLTSSSPSLAVSRLPSCLAHLHRPPLLPEGPLGALSPRERACTPSGGRHSRLEPFLCRPPNPSSKDGARAIRRGPPGTHTITMLHRARSVTFDCGE